MKARSILGILVLGAVVLALFFEVGAEKAAAPGGGATLTLKAPEFVTAARAEGGDVASDISDMLDAEAGISAYFKAPTTITFNTTIRNSFRTIEVETSDYIIGSVPITNYIENFDVHVYINKNGWLLAYYLRNDPASKIVDIKAANILTTKLKSAIATVGNAAGIAVTDVTYYDFRYPSANKILLIGEDSGNGNSFTIQMPVTNSYSQISWTHYGYACCPMIFGVDGVESPGIVFNMNDIRIGVLSASQFLPGVTHTISVYNYGVLVIIYQEL